MADLTTATMMTSTDQVLAQTTQTTTSPKPMNEELDLEIVSSTDDLYPWAADNNERRRAFILEFHNWNPDIHVDAQIQQLNSKERWLKGQGR